MNTEQFIKHINTLRKTNKNNWYFFSGTVNSKKVIIKGYNLWLQVFRVDGINQDPTMEQTVKQFKETLNIGLEQ